VLESIEPIAKLDLRDIESDFKSNPEIESVTPAEWRKLVTTDTEYAIKIIKHKIFKDIKDFRDTFLFFYRTRWFNRLY